ncbi:MAG: hypothetical protein A3I66_02950 [Burkholderiales bacterium RIFCSPLOWO2_02_FULL_57_36]|nr:MAG: hypothetical protein A3I66_02950 [Burkholderiales bacterium RIFCSPLOWO2_02_FULL_57_36]
MLVALLFSPPVTNLAQLLLVIVVLASSELRGRVLLACRQPLVIGALAFYAVLSVGVIYSIASPSEVLGMWSGWRKLLLLPLAIALFDEPRWKLRLVHVLIGVSVASALASYFGWLTHTAFPVPSQQFGIVIRNHATQGMIFGVAAFAAATLGLRPAAGSMAERLFFGVCTLLLVVNIALVTPGRSGYVVLLTCSLVLVAGSLFVNRTVTLKSVLLAVTTFGLIITLLAVSPLSRQRITQGLDEAETYHQAHTVTSMGIRMFFWKNTVTMINERPLFGYGTGAFQEAYRLQIDGKDGVAGTLTGDPHNQFLKIAAEHGLAGLAIFLAFLASALAQRASAPYRMLGLGVLFAWCITSLANSHFSTFSEGTFIYLWLGAMLANDNDAPLKRPS